MKSPAFSFYVRDWLCSKTVSKLHSKSTSKLHSRGLNAYIFLLCEAWLDTPQATLPDDDDELATLARVTPEEWQVIKPTLMLAFKKDERTGRLFNERLLHEANKQLTRKQNGSKGGSKTQANRAATLEDENEDENGTSSSQVEGIYHAYPKKVGKPKAIAAIRSALKKISAEELLQKTAQFAVARVGGDPHYTPNPTTWFNQERYNDDPSTWTDSSQREKQKPAPESNQTQEILHAPRL